MKYFVRDMRGMDLKTGQSLKSTVSGEVSRHEDAISALAAARDLSGRLRHVAVYQEVRENDFMPTVLELIVEWKDGVPSVGDYPNHAGRR